MTQRKESACFVRLPGSLSASLSDRTVLSGSDDCCILALFRIEPMPTFHRVYYDVHVVRVVSFDLLYDRLYTFSILRILNASSRGT